MGTNRLARVAALSLALVGVAGCENHAEDANVRSTITKYLDAVSGQRYEDACGMLHHDLRRHLGKDCARGLAQRYTGLSIDVRDELDNIDVAGVSVDGETAVVQPTEIRVVTSVKTTSNGKDSVRKRYYPAPDVTRGAGFTLKKVSGHWRITAGI